MSSNGITFQGDFEDYEDAKQNCNNSAGYSSTAATDHYVRRYKEVRADVCATVRSATEQILRFCTALSFAEPIDGVYEVYDYGGGYGAIYEIFRYLYPEKNFRWTIIELPEIVARQHEMGATEQKRFATELHPGRYSLGIVSGVLQCLPNPKQGLEKVKAAGARVTFINRFPLTEFLERDRLAVQHVPDTMFAASFPVWFFAPNWLEAMSPLGDLLMQWHSPGDRINLDGKIIEFQSCLYRRKFASDESTGVSDTGSSLMPNYEDRTINLKALRSIATRFWTRRA